MSLLRPAVRAAESSGVEALPAPTCVEPEQPARASASKPVEARTCAREQNPAIALKRITHFSLLVAAFFFTGVAVEPPAGVLVVMSPPESVGFEASVGEGVSSAGGGVSPPDDASAGAGVPEL